MGGLRAKSRLKVGSADPFATASKCSVLAFSIDSAAALRSGRDSTAICRKSSKLRALSVEIERTVDVELLHRRAVIQQRQKLNLRRTQIDLRGLHIGLELDALQLQANQIHLRDVARL